MKIASTYFCISLIIIPTAGKQGVELHQLDRIAPWSHIVPIPIIPHIYHLLQSRLYPRNCRVKEVRWNRIKPALPNMKSGSRDLQTAKICLCFYFAQAMKMAATFFRISLVIAFLFFPRGGKQGCEFC